MAKLKTKRERVSIALMHGGEPDGWMEVDAYVANGLAIHRAVMARADDEPGDRGLERSWWAITHIQSGTTVWPLQIATFALARKVLAGLLGIGVDWRMSQAEIRKLGIAKQVYGVYLLAPASDDLVRPQ